jgi:hypothetical protein
MYNLFGSNEENSLKILTSGTDFMIIFSSSIMYQKNKLECLSVKLSQTSLIFVEGRLLT